MNNKDTIFVGCQGQFGDIIIDTVLYRLCRLLYPNKKIIANINKKNFDIIPLLYNNKYIDGVRIWDGYDDWPNSKDKEFIRSVSENSIVFNATPKNTSNYWFRHYHITQENCIRYGFNDLSVLNNDLECYLDRWFDVDKKDNYIAFAPFAAWYNPNSDKRLSLVRAQEIVNMLIGMGYKILQLGGFDEPKLENVEKYNYSILESIKSMLGCKLLLHTDTFLGWPCSAYKHKQIGLYSNAYYGQYMKNLQPFNKNSIYLERFNVNEIPLEEIETSIKQLI